MKDAMINTLSTVYIRGIAGVALVEATPDFTPENIAKMGQLIIQIVIGVATIVSMFKKAKQPVVNMSGAQPEVKEGQPA